MNGRRKIICLGKVGLLTFAILGGVICSVNVHQNHIIRTEKCEIITLSAEPSNYLEVNWIRKYNPSLSEGDANDLYRHIERTIERYHADPSYQKGVTQQVTPRLMLSLILRESGLSGRQSVTTGQLGFVRSCRCTFQASSIWGLKVMKIFWRQKRTSKRECIS